MHNYLVEAREFMQTDSHYLFPRWNVCPSIHGNQIAHDDFSASVVIWKIHEARFALVHWFRWSDENLLLDNTYTMIPYSKRRLLNVLIARNRLGKRTLHRQGLQNECITLRLKTIYRESVIWLRPHRCEYTIAFHWHSPRQLDNSMDFYASFIIVPNPWAEDYRIPQSHGRKWGISVSVRLTE